MRALALDGAAQTEQGCWRTCKFSDDAIDDETDVCETINTTANADYRDDPAALRSVRQPSRHYH